MQSDEEKIDKKEVTKQDIDIKAINQKTNISINVIQSLFDKKFETFSYPQAIGAINIIEREFDNMDMKNIKKECKEYFKEHPLDDGVSVIKPIDEDRPIIPQILIILILGFLAYGAWYFFTEYYNKQIMPVSTIKTIKLGDAVLQKNDTEKKKIIEPKIIEAIDETNNSIEIAKIEENQTEENKTTANIIIDKNITEDTNRTKVKTILPISTIVIEEVKKPIKEEMKIIDNPTPRTIITLIPNEYMWFRLINLSDKKRRAYKRRTQYKIDMRENDWLFATENSSFALKDNGKLYKYSEEGKSFFKLDQTGIHKLTEERFRALEK